VSDEVFRVCWDEQSAVARVDWLPGSSASLEEARAVTAQVGALGRGQVPLLVDMRDMLKLDRGAREHFITSDVARAVALVAKSPVTKMMANFFIGMQRGLFPVKVLPTRKKRSTG
jgi:hypothetical protein